jgi:hypothetical protein
VIQSEEQTLDKNTVNLSIKKKCTRKISHAPSKDTSPARSLLGDSRTNVGSKLSNRSKKSGQSKKSKLTRNDSKISKGRRNSKISRGNSFLKIAIPIGQNTENGEIVELDSPIPEHVEH